MIDRRKTGVNRVVSTDGNGGETVAYNLTATWGKAQTVLGVLIAAGTILGGVFIAARVGVQIEVKDAIKVEAQDEKGVIHQEIHACVEEVVEEVQAVFQDDLDVFDGEQREQGKAIARVEVQQKALDEKMDDNKEDLIREIRLAAGGNG